MATASTPSSAATLTHRWSFNGTTDSENLRDSIGGVVAKKMHKTANATTVEGGTVNWSNDSAVLPGGGGAGHLNFGEGVLGTGSAATLEVWMKKTVDPNAWAYAASYYIPDAARDLFTLSASCGSGDASRHGTIEQRVNNSNSGMGNQAVIGMPVNVRYHISATFTSNGSGGTVVRWMMRNATTGFVLSDVNFTAGSWTLSSAASAGWSLALGVNPWTNSTLDLGCEIDEVRIWDDVLSDEQLTANVLAGPDNELGGGVNNVIIPANTTFTVPTVGGYGYKTDSAVSLGAGAKIYFDTTSYFGKGLRFKTGGISVPSGSVLDYVELSDSENYAATMEDANTILVQLKATIPYESTWSGGTPSSASDFSNASNWTSVNAAGSTISAVPASKTTVILPAATLATFTLPFGFTPEWGRVILGGHTATQAGRYGTKIDAKQSSFLGIALGSYASLGALGIDTINGNATSWQNSNIVNAQVRFDGWFLVSAAQAGRWKLNTDFDDVSAFAIDGEWIYLDPKWEPNNLTAGCFVSEGWHRFTFIAGDTGGGKGCEVTVNNVKVPFSISINGGSATAFHLFTFGSDADTVTLAGDCDWSALGELALDSGAVIDLNGHDLVIDDLTSDFIGAAVTNSSSSKVSTIYFPSDPYASKASALGIIKQVGTRINLMQNGLRTATWTGAAGDGDVSNAANWSLKVGSETAPDPLPTAQYLVQIAGANINMQVPSGTTLDCAAIQIQNCTFTADCDWRGLSKTPAIVATADLNGHNLRLAHLLASAGASLANTGAGVSAVVFDAAVGKYAESDYIDGVANLGTSENARIVIKRSSDDTVSSLNIGNSAGVWSEVLLTNGTFSATSDTTTIGKTGGARGVLTVADGADVTLGDTPAWKGVTIASGTAGGRLDITGGRLTTLGWVDVGWSGNAEAKINLRGGEHVSNCSLEVGRGNGGVGYYEMSGGAFSATGGHLHIGQVGGSTGYFNQSGGEANVNGGNFTLAYNTNSRGTYDQTGGTLTSSLTIHIAGDGTINGQGGTGEFDIGGVVNANAGVNVGGGPNGVGIIVLKEGGVLTTPYLKRGAGTAKATFAGGKIVAKDASNAATFISGISNVTYAAGGLTVDTVGYNVSMTDNVVSDARIGSALVKQGAGTLTVDSIPPVDTVKVEGGALAVQNGADNTASSITNTLAHRWSFNGDFSDSVGNVTATILNGSVTFEDNAEAILPGGDEAGAISLGTGVLGSGNATIEIWGTHARDLGMAWSYLAAYGDDSNSIFGWAWRAGANWYDNAEIWYGGTKLAGQNIIVYRDEDGLRREVGKEYHLAVTFTDNGDGTTNVRFSRRDTSTDPMTVVTRDFNNVAWSIAEGVSSWALTLGHNPFSNSNTDAAAKYNEVRVWHSALSDETLAVSALYGPDATAAQIATLVNAASGRTLNIASGATLDLGGYTLTQPVVKGAGTVRNGTLDITDRIVVNLADCIAGNCLAANGTIDFTGATLVFEDPETLATHSGSITFVKPAAGGSVTFVGVPACELPKGWSISTSGGRARLLKEGFSIFVR